MMEEMPWRETNLGEVCEAQGGSIQTGPFGSQLHASDYKETGVPVVMPADIVEYRVSEAAIARITEEDADRLGQHRLKSGDIVFSRRGDVTRFAHITDREIGWLCGTGCLKIRLGQKVIADDRFMSFYLRLPDIKEWLIRHAVGATMPNLNTGILSAIPLHLPPLQEQLAIADSLGQIEDRITLLRETNATLEAIAQALFKSWFVDFDPVRAKAEGGEPQGVPPEVADLFPNELVESELGKIPKGWKPGKLADVALNYREGVDPTELSEDTPYIGLEHMPRQSIALNAWEGAGKVESGKSRFAEGDILFGKLRPYFHKVGIAPVSGICSTDILVIRPKVAGWGAFCLCHFASKKLIDYAAQLSNGAKMPRVNWKDIAAYPAAIPTAGLAQAFNGLIVPLVTRITANVHQAKTLADLRDTLLPRLMSGKLRIAEAEKELEAV